MRLIKFSTALVAAAFFSSILTTNLLAQNAPAGARLEQSYEVILQIVTGPGDTKDQKDLPDSLSAIQKQIKTMFGTSNLRLMNTFIGRINNAGGIEYKGILNTASPTTENSWSSFLEWSLGNFQVNPNEAAAATVSIQSFHFGARVPLTTVIARPESGKQLAPVSYEAIGLNLARVGLSMNQPTLVGTLDVPGLNGMTFLILTVRPV